MIEVDLERKYDYAPLPSSLVCYFPPPKVAISLAVEGCIFTHCRAASDGGAVLVVFTVAMEGTLAIVNSQFGGCGAASLKSVYGGAVAAMAQEVAARMVVLIDRTSFDGSWLYSAGLGTLLGGHFSLVCYASNTTIAIKGSNFTNGVMETVGSIIGGCYVEYGTVSTNIFQEIEGCIFQNNTLIGGGNVYGGMYTQLDKYITYNSPSMHSMNKRALHTHYFRWVGVTSACCVQGHDLHHPPLLLHQQRAAEC
jgi:hypothetical protein